MKKELYKEAVMDLYGYKPNCKHTIKAYKEMIYTHFMTKKEADKFIKGII